ncbi:MAG: HypC/HybG/HupF family hydrogenase formation chaperone [Candidatus Thermoplasmatota archaeon]
MCLAIPAKIIEKKGNKAIVDYGGVKREVDISLVGARKGDYVIVHAGFAIQIIDEKEAMKTVKIFEEILKNA